MQPNRCTWRRASGLIIALGVLAMMAVMATTFVTLMRVNTRVSRVYTDDLITEMLASGVANYCLSILCDDQDRTMYKYENRDAAIGGGSYGQGQMSIRGRNTDYWAPIEHRYGTPASNDVWLHSASGGYVGIGLYGTEGHRETQASLGGGSDDFVIVRRDESYVGWNDTEDQSRPERYYSYVPGNFNGLDDDLSGTADPPYVWPAGRDSELYVLTDYHYDTTLFLTHGHNCHLHPGGKLTGAFRLPGGAAWRWAAKMGIPEERYINLNAVGNNDRLASVGTARLSDLDGKGLHAVNGDPSVASNQLGVLSWKGYEKEYYYQVGFPKRFNVVQYSPYQLDPYRLLAADLQTFTGGSQSDGILDWTVVRPMAEGWVKKRWGSDSIPADGSDRWRIGWRRDGASYYKIPSPDNPMGNDYYFGGSEALTHQNEDIVPGTSRVFQTMLEATGGDLNMARYYFGRARSRLSTYGCDTILRGKLWPDEGWLPWRPDGSPGDWRHMDILRKVNINMLGAKGTSDGLRNEDTATKALWASKAARERDRLYFMLKAMLNWSNTPRASHEACQLVASLTDMVDRDQQETFYIAPDEDVNTAVANLHCALGYEKHPVINEVVVFVRNATTPNYELFRFRVELYNPFENIPWIPDAEEGYDISEYVLRIGTHNYRLGNPVLKRYTSDSNAVHPDGMVIGAGGMYGDPNDTSTDPHTGEPITWNRFVHIGWDYGAGVTNPNWPQLLTQAEIEAPIVISLWKPLHGDAEQYLPLNDGMAKVEMINGRKFMCVDRTEEIQLIRPYTPPAGPGDRAKGKFTGVYRRWDPMNAKVFLRPDSGYAEEREKCNVIWCEGWSIADYPTLGRPNAGYPANASNHLPPVGAASPYKYERRFEVNYKIPDSDLPSVGWLGEVFLKNCGQGLPLTWRCNQAQEPAVSDRGSRLNKYANILETMKLDLFKPWENSRNLHLYDMFTVWDPMHDGIDNDGDGAIDEADTGYQSGDLWGPEVRVYGAIDINHADVRALWTTMPGEQVPAMAESQNYGPYYERRRANNPSSDWHGLGPRDSIGDMLRWDDLHTRPGARFGVTYAYNPGTYVSTANLVGQGDSCGIGWTTSDDDGDGIADERDERDFWFTQAANFMTTRSHNMTIEIVAQLTEPFYHPGTQTPGTTLTRGSYKTRHVYTQKHLILLVDRSTTLRIGENGQCDFTGPVRILARRWAYMRR